MLSLTPIVALLEAKPAGFPHAWFRKVDGAAEYARIRPEALPLPAAWVVRAADKSKRAGERAEDVDIGFDVVIAIENARKHKPNELDDELLAYRLAVKNLLLGWELTPGVTPLQFGGGQVLEYTDQDLYWRDRYLFSAQVTNYLPDPPPFQSANYTGDKL